MSAGTPPALLAEVERFPLARDTTSARIPCHVNPHHRGRPARACSGLCSRRWQAWIWAGGGQKVGTPWEAAGSANEALLARFCLQRRMQGASPRDANPRQPAWKAGGRRITDCLSDGSFAIQPISRLIRLMLQTFSSRQAKASSAKRSSPHVRIRSGTCPVVTSSAITFPVTALASKPIPP